MLMIGTVETIQQLGEVLNELNKEISHYEDIVKSKKTMADRIAKLIEINITLAESTDDLTWAEQKITSMNILKQTDLLEFKK